MLYRRSMLFQIFQFAAGALALPCRMQTMCNYIEGRMNRFSIIACSGLIFVSDTERHLGKTKLKLGSALLTDYENNLFFCNRYSNLRTECNHVTRSNVSENDSSGSAIVTQSITANKFSSSSLLTARREKKTHLSFCYNGQMVM